MADSQEFLESVLADKTLPEPVLKALSSGARLEHIELSAEGQWLHEGQPISHPRVCALFSRSIERTPGGTFVLHVPPYTYPITVADTPYFVLRIEVLDQPAGAVRLELSDGSVELLDAQSLRYVAERGFYCRVKGGAYFARFSRPAYYALSEFVVEDGDGFALNLAGQQTPIATAAWPLTLAK